MSCTFMHSYYIWEGVFVFVKRELEGVQLGSFVLYLGSLCALFRGFYSKFCNSIFLLPQRPTIPTHGHFINEFIGAFLIEK